MARKYRSPEEIKDIAFRSPNVKNEYVQGGIKWSAIGKIVSLPRNVILIRFTHPKVISNPEIFQNAAEFLYNTFLLLFVKKLWLHGYAHGSVQQAINIRNVKTILKENLKDNLYIMDLIKISKFDNYDNTQLQQFDILLNRIGDQQIGRPHLIL